jgi:large subunit ribosomal protein L5
MAKTDLETAPETVKVPKPRTKKVETTSPDEAAPKKTAKAPKKEALPPVFEDKPAKVEKEVVAEVPVASRKYRSRLEELYYSKLQKELKDELGYSSIMEAPRLEKVVLNMGLKDAVSDGKAIEFALKDLATITGQKAVATKAKKAIAAFKIREGLAIGCKVTLRGIKMYDFLDKLVNIALPRVRDFRGVPANAFDGRGNYTFGVKEQLIFPEIKYEETKLRGLDITIVTSARSDRPAHLLLSKIGMPFAK